MTVPAEPRPITLPLPGGQEGAHVRLRPLLTGEIATPPGFLERLPGRLAGVRGYGLHTRRRHWPWAPVPAFLLEHPGAGPILVDTGLHESLARSKRNVGLAGVLFSFRVGAGQTVRERLQQRGLAVAEIDTVIMTHLHNDHASAVEDFPDSTFVLDRREWEAAWRKAPSFRGYQRRQFDHRFDWRSVDFEAPGVDAFATFGRTLDLFGDGSVRLLSTPGHTPGHMSLLLRLRHREALITVDAAYTRRTIDESVMPLLTDDVHRFRRSLGEIQRYVAQTPGSLVIPGHDAETWRGLDPVYV